MFDFDDLDPFDTEDSFIINELMSDDDDDDC